MPFQSDAAPRAQIAYDAQQNQLHVLQQRRDIISEQYQTAMQERGRIGQERLNAQARGDAQMVKEYDASINRLGDRLQNLEKLLRSADQQLDEAVKGQLVAPVAEEAPPPPEAPPAVGPLTFTVTPPPDPVLLDQFNAQRREFQRMMAFEAFGFVALGILLWRFGMARGKRAAVQEAQLSARAPEHEDRLIQAVDAIAIEVERLSEGQRFLSNLMATRRPERDALPVSPRVASSPSDEMRITPH